MECFPLLTPGELFTSCEKEDHTYRRRSHDAIPQTVLLLSLAYFLSPALPDKLPHLARTHVAHVLARQSARAQRSLEGIAHCPGPATTNHQTGCVASPPWRMDGAMARNSS